MANVTTQSNPGYIGVAYPTLRGRTPFAAIVRSVAEFFGKKGCVWGYGAFREKLAISKTTAWRNLSKIKDEDGFSVAMGEKSGWIHYNGELKKETHIRIEYWFLTEKFTFTYKNKETGEIKTVVRSLTPCEVLCLAFIYTHARNNKEKTADGMPKNQCECTYRDMAGRLDMAEETACRAVQELIAAGLVNQQIKGWSKQASIFKINWKAVKPYALAHKRVKKAETSKQDNVAVAGNVQTTSLAVDARKKAIEDVNARSERERYYARLREQAQNRADQALERAKSNVEFKNVDRALSKMEIELAKVELYKPEELGDLLVKRQRLTREREVLLSRLGISARDLQPQYRCSKCSDTGFNTKNGKSCDCYPKGGRT